MDIGIVLDRIRLGAKYRRYSTYAELAATWEDDAQTLPTEQEIIDEWAVYEAERAAVKYSEDRAAAYEAEGFTPDALIVALWEKTVETRPAAADAIEVKRQAIKARFPKPV